MDELRRRPPPEVMVLQTSSQSVSREVVTETRVREAPVPARVEQPVIVAQKPVVERPAPVPAPAPVVKEPAPAPIVKATVPPPVEVPEVKPATPTQYDIVFSSTLNKEVAKRGLASFKTTIPA